MLKKSCILLLFIVIKMTGFSQKTPVIEVVSHNHVALQVMDIGKSTTFYREVLGLQSIPVPDSLKAIRSWFKVGDHQQIHLLAGRVMPVNNNRNGSHFALFVRSIADTENFLLKHKIAYHIQVRFDGAKQIYIADPDGYLIEFNEQKAIR